MIMKWSYLMLSLWFIASYSYAIGSELLGSKIDSQALGDKRLFFSGEERKSSEIDTNDALLSKPPTSFSNSDNTAAGVSISREYAGAVLHFNGLVYSERGVQILINGYPWVPGKFSVTSARLQIGTQLIEVETTSGGLYRLQFGDKVKVGP